MAVYNFIRCGSEYEFQWGHFKETAALALFPLVVYMTGTRSAVVAAVLIWLGPGQGQRYKYGNYISTGSTDTDFKENKQGSLKLKGPTLILVSWRTANVVLYYIRRRGLLMVGLLWKWEAPRIPVDVSPGVFCVSKYNDIGWESLGKWHRASFNVYYSLPALSWQKLQINQVCFNDNKRK